MKRLMDPEALEGCLDRLATALIADRDLMKAPVLVGVRRRGVPLAERLAERLAASGGQRPDVGSLDIAFYRDDLSRVAQQPLVGVTDIPFSVDDRDVCLVDDVLYTGRTVRAALDALLELGRPRRIRLAVLVDRGHRELPIQADYVGLTLTTKADDDVRVMIRPIDESDGVFLASEEERK